MKTQCPQCKAGFEVPETYSGKKVKCPKCKQEFTVSPYIARNPAPQAPPLPDIPDDDFSIPSRQMTAADYERKIRFHKRQEKEATKELRIDWILDFFLFRKMIFPWLIIIFFAIAFIATLIYPLFEFISTPQPKQDGPFFYEPPFIFSLLQHKWLMAWIALLWLRIVSEWLILFFRIHQDTRYIAEAIEDQTENELQKASA